MYNGRIQLLYGADVEAVVGINNVINTAHDKTIASILLLTLLTPNV